MDFIFAFIPLALFLLVMGAEAIRRRIDARRREVTPPEKPASGIPGDMSQKVRLKARGVRVSITR